MKRASFALMILFLFLMTVPGCGDSGPRQVIDASDKAAIDAYVEQQKQDEEESRKTTEEMLKNMERK